MYGTGRKWLGYSPGICLDTLGQNHEVSVKIASVLAGIQTRHLLNTDLDPKGTSLVVWGSGLACSISSTLKMEAACSFKMSVHVYQIIC
jgi:hypothetical protein